MIVEVCLPMKIFFYDTYFWFGSMSLVQCDCYDSHIHLHTNTHITVQSTKTT